MKTLPILPCLLLLAACGPRVPESARTPPAPEPEPLVAPELREVADHLDTGGLSFAIVNGQYEWETIEPFFAYLQGMAAMFRQMDEAAAVPPRVFELVDELPSRIGLDQLKARGSSTVKLPDGPYLSRSVMQTTPNADGLIWRLEGDAVDFREEIRRLPDTTVLMARVSLDAPELYRSVKQTLLEFPQLEQPVAGAEAAMGRAGLPLQSLLEGFKQGHTVAVSLNPEFEWILPGMPTVKTPEIGVMAVLSDPDGSLGAWIIQTLSLKSPLPMVPLEVEGRTVHSIGIPAPVSTAVALQFANVDGRLLIASSPVLMQKLLQRRGGGGDTPLLASLEPIDNPTASQGWVARADLAQTVKEISKGAALANVNTDKDLRMVEAMMEQNFQSFFPMPYVMLSRAEGDFRISTLLHDRPMNLQLNGATVMTVPAVTGLLAAIALPGFQKARTTAQMNACINNLRMMESAKDQWAIEEGLATGDPVSLDNIAPYLREIPTCPQGGDYTLHAVGVDVVCSIPGHELP